MTKVSKTPAKVDEIKPTVDEAVAAPAPVIDEPKDAEGELVSDPASEIDGVNDVTVDNGEQLAPIELADAVFTHAVKAGPAKGFHRAGKFWTREETMINRADFTDEQWEAIEAEPMLSIQQL